MCACPVRHIFWLRFCERGHHDWPVMPMMWESCPASSRNSVRHRPDSPLVPCCYQGVGNLRMTRSSRRGRLPRMTHPPQRTPVIFLEMLDSTWTNVRCSPALADLEVLTRAKNEPSGQLLYDSPHTFRPFLHSSRPGALLRSSLLQRTIACRPLWFPADGPIHRCGKPEIGSQSCQLGVGNGPVLRRPPGLPKALPGEAENALLSGVKATDLVRLNALKVCIKLQVDTHRNRRRSDRGIWAVSAPFSEG